VPAIAVVGAGIVGVLTAQELARRAPEVSVHVLERDVVAGGASLRSAGLHLPMGGSERVRELTAASESYYRELVAADAGLPIRALAAAVVTRDPDGTRARYLLTAHWRPRADALPPAVRLPAGCAAFAVDGAQCADVPRLARRLIDRRPSSVVLHEGVSVTELDVRVGVDGAPLVRISLSTGHDLDVDHAVLAPGPWLSAPAWKPLVGRLGLRVKKIVALHVDVAAQASDPVVVFADEDAFLLPQPEQQRWLFSFTRREWDVDPDTVAGALGADDLAAGQELLARYAPSWAEHAASGRVFCDAYSPDREPRVEPLDDAGRIVFAGAANGSGYRLAPGLAAAAADTVLTGRSR
jgi:D-arginine dehydrogenase